MTKVITFANVKGGTGKSTLCVNVAAQLAQLGHSVSVYDADHQNSTFDWICGSKDANLSQVNCISPKENDDFKKILGKDDQNYLLIDTQGSLTKELAEYLSYSDLVLAPCRVSRDDVVGLGWIQLFLEKSKKPESKAVLLGVLNCVNKRSSIFIHIKDQLEKEGTLIAKTSITQRVAFSETNVNKRSVLGYNKLAAVEIADLTNEIVSHT